MSGVDPVLVIIAFVVAIVMTIFQWYSKRTNEQDKKPKRTKKAQAKKLTAHSEEFSKKEILTVEDNIHVAIGYGLANCILIEGEFSCVLIDTLESIEASKIVKEDFAKKVGEKPIEAIILTHFHADHSYGLDTFTKDNPNVPIYAHETFFHYFQQLLNVRMPITFLRATHQFGTVLDDKEHENSGIGIKLDFTTTSTASYNVKPTHTFKDKMDICVAGIDLVLYHAPGETNDQTIVWWPEKRILFPADNIYRAFPNLYAVRGTMARDTLTWVKAVDLMRTLKPKVMVPQHTRPLFGENEIMDTLTAYRDAIQYVHDQTVRYMNKGWYPDQITQVVQLPPHLANHPYLQEFYGTVEWSVKAVFGNYMGWFSGKASELHPLEPLEHSQHLLSLAGGPNDMLDKAQEAFEKEHYQWALELSDALIDTEKHLKAARKLKVDSLRQLAEGEVSACGRNWYYTAALITEGLELKPSTQQRKKRIHNGSMYDLFLMLTVMLDSEKTVDIEETAHFYFKDTDEHIILKIRRGVAELLTDPEQAGKVDLKVTTSNKVWRNIMSKDRSAAAASLVREIVVVPTIRKLGTFMAYFDTEA